MRMKRTVYTVIIIYVAITLSSCSTAPVNIAPYPARVSGINSPIGLSAYGTTHIVEHGETLWHISKIYNVSINDLLKVNNLKEGSTLETGQYLFIPAIVAKQPTIPLYSTSRWQYIIIHHSATDEGDVCFLDRLHRRRGWCGIGYDFVIDNGTKGKQDGEIEASERWLKQENGAHCRASEMNYKVIGICLVGNFSKEKVSKKQLDSLVYLVNILMKYYKIPMNHIMGHGQVRGARTECPGKYFPWQEFKSELNNHN